MSAGNDIIKMLDDLGLTTAALRCKELLESPEFGDFSPVQLLREILTPQYIESMDNRYVTNRKFSRLINKTAKIDNLKTGNGRKYNDDKVQQVLTFRFIGNKLNVGIYGKTGAGKSYFMSALCDEACRQNYRCMLLDYSDLLDELLVLEQKDNLEKYTKKLKYYSKIKLLFIDDFAISRYSEELLRGRDQDLVSPYKNQGRSGKRYCFHLSVRSQRMGKTDQRRSRVLWQAGRYPAASDNRIYYSY